MSKKGLPIVRDIKALYQEQNQNREVIDSLQKALQQISDQLAIHGEVLGMVEAIQKEITIHGQELGKFENIEKEIAIHGQVLGKVENIEREIAIHGQVIGNILADSKSIKDEVSIHGQVIGTTRDEVEIHGAAIGANASQIEKLVSEICSMKARLNELERSLTSGTQQVPEGVFQATEQTQPSVSLTDRKQKDAYYSIDYFDFENHFRGSRQDIMERQKIYLPYFTDCNNVVDAGCGRGEFLELLLTHQIPAVGVDLYEPYVEYVKRQGLPCVCEDVNTYLKRVKQIDGIFMGQVVEHLSVSQIIELLENAYNALESGKYLIMETPNPMTLAIYSHAFYMDPSHEKPVHPYTLKYLTEKAGFSSVEILFTEASRMPFEIPSLKIEGCDLEEFNNAIKNLNNDLYGSQDYAIIAKK